MKKVISVVLSFFILTVSISCCFSAVAEGIEDFQYRKASNELQNFAKEVYALTSEHDSDLESPHNSSNTIEATEFMSAASVENELDINYKCFETNRLIVYSDRKFDTYGATEHLSGYKDMHLLQYENLEDTISAYTYFSKNEIIDSVEPDIILTLQENTKNEVSSLYIDYPHDSTLESSWGYERIQTYDAFQYILQHNALEDLPEIVVGIIDGGIAQGNKYFDERFIGAYSFIGKDPYIDTSGHGSKVAGVILENTLPNVKIVSYQAFDNGSSTLSLTQLAEEQARLDKVDIINCSYTTKDYEKSSNTNSTDIKDDVPLQIAAAGNHSNRLLGYPAAYSGVIGVANIEINDRLASSSARGNWVDVAAPGSNNLIPRTDCEGESINFGGTSCSTPFVVSICAMIMSQYPSLSNSSVAEVLFNSCETADINVYHGIVNMFKAVTYYDTEIRQTATPEFNIEAQPSEKRFYEESQYVELSCSEENAEIYYTTDGTIPSKVNGILYTKPIELTTSTSVYAVAYTNEYFRSEISKRLFLIRTPIEDSNNENGWYIRDNGMIYGYTGPDMNLVVPKSVLGIDVVGIESKAFYKQAYIESVTLPDCLTIIEERAFYGCNSLASVIAPGVVEIGTSAFWGCSCLDDVYLPKLEKISEYSFRFAGALNGFPFETLEKIPRYAFADSQVYSVNLENTTLILNYAFYRCNSLTNISLPVIETLGTGVFKDCLILDTVELNPEKDTIEEATFDGCTFSKLDFFEQLQYIDGRAFANNNALSDIEMNSLIYLGPNAFENCNNLYKANFKNISEISNNAFENCTNLTELTLSDNVEFIDIEAFKNCTNLQHLEIKGNVDIADNVFVDSGVKRLEFNAVVLVNSLPVIENSIIAMPSTFTECTEDTIGRNYQVYGTVGTNAEKWAKENGHTFVEISQDTTILKDVPMEYTGNGEILSVDVIGFNRTYQWYSNTEANNTIGTPIDGATSKDFNPADYPAAHYYYCVITSTDKGCPTVEIRTDVTKNTTYSTDSMLSAMSSQIRFKRNADGSYANIFDVRTRAMITDEDFKAYIADTNDEAELVISKVGFVYSRGSNSFSTEDAKKVAQGEHIDGYADAPVSYIQDADGYYMFTCLVVDIPIEDMKENLTTYAYICVDDKWYFFDAEVTADFNSLHSTCYPQAAEKYGWEG